MSAMDQDALAEALAQRYDRQVRVWGAEAQVRIQQSKVLCLGFKGINVEAAKNLVLAGVSIAIYEEGRAQESDLAYNFFLTHSDIGSNIAEASAVRLRLLNPFVAVTVESRSVLQLEQSYFDQFSVVLATDSREADVIRVNNYVRQLPGRAFFWSGGFGMDAWFVSDFGPSFSYKDDPPKNKDTVTVSFPSIEKVLARPWSQVASKKYPLSPTFVRFRILETYRNKYGRLPVGEKDFVDLLALAKEVFTQNGIPIGNLDTDSSANASMDLGSGSSSGGGGSCSSNSSANSSNLWANSTDLCSIEDVKALTSLSQLDGTSCNICVLPCSVLGSFLSQEIIKAVSWTGEPALNTFIYNGSLCEAKCIPIL